MAHYRETEELHSKFTKFGKEDTMLGENSAQTKYFK